MTFDPIYIVGGILGGLSQLLLLVFCIVLVFKIKNTATLLMLAGSILTIFFYVFNIIWTTIAATNGPEVVAKSVALLNVLQNIPPVIFVIGFSLFVNNHIKKN